VILLDTSGLLAAIDRSQTHHEAAARALREAPPPRLLSPFVLAELDYLLVTRVGMAAETALLDEVGRGTYQLEPMGASDVADARRTIERFPEHSIGLADASIVVLAERHDITDVLTLDEGHFRVLRTSADRRFRILPADGPSGAGRE
jgi:predicted nucleic acid-binding protein